MNALDREPIGRTLAAWRWHVIPDRNRCRPKRRCSRLHAHRWFDAAWHTWLLCPPEVRVLDVDDISVRDCLFVAVNGSYRHVGLHRNIRCPQIGQPFSARTSLEHMGVGTPIDARMIARPSPVKVFDARRPKGIERSAHQRGVVWRRLDVDPYAVATFELRGRSEEHTSELQSLMRNSY